MRHMKSWMKFVLWLTVILGLVFLVYTANMAESDASVTCTPGNHRSYHNATISEESQASFDHAPAGSWNEIDLRSASDSTYWALHDRDAFRVTGTHLSIEDSTASQIRQLTFPDGTGLLSLTQTLNLAQQYQIPVYIEFKEYGLGEWTDSELRGALDKIIAHPYGHRVFVGGVEGFLRYVHETYGEAVRTFWRPDNDQDATSPSSNWGHIDLITPSPEEMINHPVIVDGIRAYGARPGTRNTLNEQVADLLDIEVRWIQTNTPRAVLKVCANYEG